MKKNEVSTGLCDTITIPWEPRHNEAVILNFKLIAPDKEPEITALKFGELFNI